jgi:arylsulfatase A-like enzyme
LAEVEELLVVPVQCSCRQAYGLLALRDRNGELHRITSRYTGKSHGFDEFFGNLYHLNAEEEPENQDYPKNPQFKAAYGPRGVLKCVATTTGDPTEDPRFGRMGKQKCTDTGPLNAKRMETVDEEFLSASFNFIDRAHSSGKPRSAFSLCLRVSMVGF